MEIQAIKLTTPLTKEKLASLNIGDVIELTGVIYTARDAAHKKLQDNIESNIPQPVDFKNQIIYYVGPSPAKHGKVIGSLAPTTSIRMDKYVEMMLELDLIGMIGKGERADYVADLCREYRVE